MVKPKKTGVVPKLRFPEFAGSPEWNAEQMDALYLFMRNNTLSRDKLNYEGGTVKNIHYGDIHTKFSTHFDITKELVPYLNDTEEIPKVGSNDYCTEGDIIFADASEDMNDVGKSIEVIRLVGQLLLSGQHTILARRRNDALFIGFGGHLFRSARIRSKIQKESQGTKIYQISPTRLAKIEIVFPEDKQEQQKIADCLTSLDELIAAQGRKVEALKSYKRGLMQQLFPREGETEPRLRFPEFRDGPGWVELPLSKLAEYENGKAYEQDIHEDGVYSVVNSRFISTDGLVRKRTNANYCIASEGNVLMVLSDLPNGRALAKCFYVDSNESYAVNQRVARLTPTTAYPKFLYYRLNRHSKLLAFDDGLNQTHLSKGSVTDCPLLVPIDRDEQQRIAELLTSLDAQFVVESDRLNVFRTHKKAIMQQLFPAVEESEA